MIKQPQVIFAKLKADNQPIVVDSICVQCESTGQTTILLTIIPFFREIIIISFNCQNCGFKNNQIQFGGKLAQNGVNIIFKVTTAKDLNRQLIKSQYAKITIPQLEFQIPPNKKAEVTTIQGLFVRCIQDLQSGQPLRKIMDANTYQKISEFLEKLRNYQTGLVLPFTISIEDPSGNSFIKNPLAPKIDHNLHYTFYKRTNQQIQAMGYSVSNANQQLEQIQKNKKQQKEKQVVESKKYKDAHMVDFTQPFNQQNFAKTEGLIFNVPCHSCGLLGQTKMCQTNIPYFHDLIIMSFSCEYCGAHSTETKTSGEVKPLGTKIILKNPKQIDLKRDLFKSQTCAVQVPELQLELDYGTLGGVYTTVQGLFQKIYDHLSSNNPFADSDKQFSQRMDKLLDSLNECRNNKRQFTLILNDPLGHSFLQNPYHPKQDINVIIEEYERTEDQNEFLGLLDMNVDHYKS